MTKIFMKVAQEREGLLFVVAGSLRWDIVSGSREAIAIEMTGGQSHCIHSQEAESRQDMGLGYKTLRTTPIGSLPHPHTSSLELVLHLIALLLQDTWPITPTNTISPTWVLSTYPYFLSSHWMELKNILGMLSASFWLCAEPALLRTKLCSFLPRCPVRNLLCGHRCVPRKRDWTRVESQEGHARLPVCPATCAFWPCLWLRSDGGGRRREKGRRGNIRRRRRRRRGEGERKKKRREGEYY